MTTRARARSYNTSGPAPVVRNGLIFPPTNPSGFDHASDGTAFFWSSPLAHYPATYIFRCNYVSQIDYYTNFFRCGNYGGAFSDETGFYGCHPYPQNGTLGATPHTFEISTGASPSTDIESSPPHFSPTTLVSYGVWYTHCVIVSGTAIRPIIEFYWDFANNTNKITYNWGVDRPDPNYVDGPTPGLMFGENPWPGEKSEAACNTTRGLQIYSTNLSLANAQTEAANDTVNTPQTASGISNVWYMNQNPTPTDIADKSGAGHSPAWYSAKRPTLYTG